MLVIECDFPRLGVKTRSRTFTLTGRPIFLFQRVFLQSWHDYFLLKCILAQLTLNL